MSSFCCICGGTITNFPEEGRVLLVSQNCYEFHVSPCGDVEIEVGIEGEEEVKKTTFNKLCSE